MTNLIKIISGSVTSLLLATSVHAIDVGVGASVGSVDVGVGASVGHGSAASAGIGTSVGGSSGASAGAGASVGGGSTAAAGFGASVGGSGNGTGSGAGVGGSPTTPGGITASIGLTNDRSAATTQTTVASKISIDSFLGATIVTSDRAVMGMIEQVRACKNGKFVATVRMKAAFGAQEQTIQLNLQSPEKNPDRIRIAFTRTSLLARINS